jgi:hypothetical protein
MSRTYDDFHDSIRFTHSTASQAVFSFQEIQK